MRRAALVLILAVMLLPLFFLVQGSFQNLHGTLVMPPRITTGYTLKHYQWILTLPILPMAINTAAVTLATAALTSAVVGAGAYAFAMYPLPRWLWTLLLAGIMVPRMAMMVPLFVIMKNLGITGTLWAAILPAAYMPAGLYIANAYYRTIPRSLIDSARIDGAHEYQILARIILPIAKPVTATIALFSAVGAMQDFLWQMLQLQRPRVHTLLVGLFRAVLTAGSIGIKIDPIGQRMAVAVVLAAPLLAVFLIANRYFTTALGGATKE